MPPLRLRVPRTLVPGLALTGGIGVVSWWASQRLGETVPSLAVDAVVLAILGGVAVRALWEPGDRTLPGISYAAKQLLELAIVLLGFSTDMRSMVSTGGPLAAAIALVTAAALGAGLLWGRVFGLPRSHALLVASGNAICGNSAIAAVASVTGAPREETASSVAYTAILSLALVLLLPVVRGWLQLGDLRYGVATGLTVYAVPQVLAAAYPVSVRAGQVGTMVKLVRVLMLVPLVTFLSIRRQRRTGGGSGRIAVHRLVPWYVLAFLVAAVTRSMGWVPAPLANGAQLSSHWLTILAMAALGLGVEARLLREVGWRTAATATVSLLTLCVLAGAVIAALPEGGF